MVELVDTADLKSAALKAYRFDSGRRYQSSRLCAGFFIMRLVLIVKNTYTVYEGRVPLTTYETDASLPAPTKEEIEWIRVQEYKDKA